MHYGFALTFTRDLVVVVRITHDGFLSVIATRRPDPMDVLAEPAAGGDRRGLGGRGRCNRQCSLSDPLLLPYGLVFTNHGLAAAAAFRAWTQAQEHRKRDAGGCRSLRQSDRSAAFSATVDLIPGTFFLAV